MKKNECAQEMILDLVMRHGCEVKIRPLPSQQMGIDVVISHRGYHSAVAIDLGQMQLCAIPTEEIVCRDIARAADDLFRHPYEQMMEKHFRKGEDHDKP